MTLKVIKAGTGAVVSAAARTVAPRLGLAALGPVGATLGTAWGVYDLATTYGPYVILGISNAMSPTPDAVELALRLRITGRDNTYTYAEPSDATYVVQPRIATNIPLNTTAILGLSDKFRTSVINPSGIEAYPNTTSMTDNFSISNLFAKRKKNNQGNLQGNQGSTPQSSNGQLGGLQGNQSGNGQLGGLQGSQGGNLQGSGNTPSGNTPSGGSPNGNKGPNWRKWGKWGLGIYGGLGVIREIGRNVNEWPSDMRDYLNPIYWGTRYVGVPAYPEKPDSITNTTPDPTVTISGSPTSTPPTQQDTVYGYYEDSNGNLVYGPLK